MCWYIFYTPRGWAAICTTNSNLSINIVRASVLPTPSPLTTLFYINRQQTGCDVRFVSSTDNSIPLITKIRDYYRGLIITDWEIKLDLNGLSDFSTKVLNYVYNIPYGETITYGEVARALGNKGASRAVGRIMSQNPIPLIIPCHRVLAQGGWGGFSAPGGVALKKQMLLWEWENKMNNTRRQS
jgi:methylated-DNA-[protein]-cysteine S-methyltransferase